MYALRNYINNIKVNNFYGNLLATFFSASVRVRVVVVVFVVISAVKRINDKNGAICFVNEKPIDRLSRILTVLNLGGGIFLQAALVDPSFRRAGVIPAKANKGNTKTKLSFEIQQT